MTDYLVYDVFSDAPFGGNQLAVIPDASALPEEDFQRIAREFNFSETTFVLPPKNTENTARVRIFTPTMEVPFAGHPLIGTAVALSDLGASEQMTLELGIGPIKCHARDGCAQFTTSQDLEIIAEPEPTLVAEALGISTDKIQFSPHPPLLATLGLAFTLTRLDHRDTLAALAPDVAAFRKGRDLHPSSLDFAQFAYVREGDTIHARMFAPLDNIPEDPATGSACATLAALIAKLQARDVDLTIHQGDDMGRPSLIGAKTKGPAVTITGQACVTMRGKLVY